MKPSIGDLLLLPVVPNCDPKMEVRTEPTSVTPYMKFHCLNRKFIYTSIVISQAGRMFSIEESLLKLVSLPVPVSLGGNLVYLGRIDTSCTFATVQLMQLYHANWQNIQSVKCRADYKWDGEVGISCWSAVWGCCDVRCVSGDGLLAESSLLPFFSLQSIEQHCNCLKDLVVVVVVVFRIQQLDKTNKSVLLLFELTFSRKLSFIIYLS